MANSKKYNWKITVWKAVKAAIIAWVSVYITTYVEIPADEKTGFTLFLIACGTALLNWAKNRNKA
jgi:hypothetical protein